MTRATESAAELSHVLQLRMVDRIILAMVRYEQSLLHTIDSDFRNIAEVE